MIIMNCCECYWQPQPPAYSRPFLRDYLPANQVPFVPDYVYNPKEARIRKAMRDQASRARAAHHQHQRQHQQQQPSHHHHHHQAQNRQQYVMQMGGRNDIISRARLNSLQRQTQSSNVQQNHKISHLHIHPHILQQKPNQIQIQQIGQGTCNESCNQQWMVGIEQRPGNQHPQQNFALSQEQHFEKTKASIREQVEHGLMDGVYGNFMDMETVSYPTTRVVEVTGSGCSDGYTDRPGSEERIGMGSHVTIPTGQEFTVYTDVDGHQHWYPYMQGDEIKIFNGGLSVNNWNHHQDQSMHQISHHHLHNDNHELKMTVENQQLFPLQCLVGPDASNPLQVSPVDVNSRVEESSQVQQYIVCPPTAPQAKFIAQTKVQEGDVKEDPDERELSQISPADVTSSTLHGTDSTLEELGQRNPDSLPLPAFQQAFGSTEIGRFANEGFLSQSPEAPNWSDPTSPFGLSSPLHSSNPTAAYYYSSPSLEELPTTHTIAFPQSLSNYFDCGMLEEIDEATTGYGDLVGLVGTESSGFDYLTLHMPPIEYSEKEGENCTSAGPEETNSGLIDQENSDLLLLTPPNPPES